VCAAIRSGDYGEVTDTKHKHGKVIEAIQVLHEPILSIKDSKLVFKKLV